MNTESPCEATDRTSAVINEVGDVEILLEQAVANLNNIGTQHETAMERDGKIHQVIRLLRMSIGKVQSVAQSLEAFS